MSDKNNHCGTLGGVGCSVTNCIYNDATCKKCTADHIKVQDESTTNHTTAACETYCPRTSW